MGKIDLLKVLSKTALCILTVMLLTNCNKQNDVLKPEDLSEVADPDFLEYCLEKFDRDRDGHLNSKEAMAVKKIQVSNPVWNSNAFDKPTEKTYFVNSLTGIEVFTELDTLYCTHNEHSDLDIRKNTKLTTLNCSFNSLPILDVSKNTELTELICHLNRLVELDISKNKALSVLWCGSNGLNKLDLSNNPELTVLQCSNNNLLTELDISKNIKLKSLNCSGCNIKTIYVWKGFNISDLLESNIPDDIVFVEKS